MITKLDHVRQARQFMNSLISVNLFQTGKLCVKDLVKLGNQLTWMQLF